MLGRPGIVAALALAVFALSSTVAGAAPGPAKNDYPTAEIVDYVLGCMAATGNSRVAMLRCSCSIDHVAARLPFARYEMAETALNMRAGGAPGGRVGLFQDPPEVKAAVDELHQAQAEASRECS